MSIGGRSNDELTSKKCYLAILYKNQSSIDYNQQSEMLLLIYFLQQCAWGGNRDEGQS